MLRSVEFYFCPDVLGQPIGPIFNGQVRERLSAWKTDKLSKKAGTELQLYAA
jgi:hypothetical protein